jgi:hypothetical protein
MPGCHDMKKGEVYYCEECGLELKVMKECREASEGAETCGCHAESGTCCEITCCDKPLTKK